MEHHFLDRNLLPAGQFNPEFEARICQVSWIIAATRMRFQRLTHEEVEASVLDDLKKALRGQATFTPKFVDGKDDYLLDAAALFLVAMQPEMLIPLSDYDAERITMLVQQGFLEGRPNNYQRGSN